jgi:transcriptional regulator with GAF, ATPase, and Fis domain
MDPSITIQAAELQLWNDLARGVGLVSGLERALGAGFDPGTIGFWVLPLAPEALQDEEQVRASGSSRAPSPEGMADLRRLWEASRAAAGTPPAPWRAWYEALRPRPAGWRAEPIGTDVAPLGTLLATAPRGTDLAALSALLAALAGPIAAHWSKMPAGRALTRPVTGNRQRLPSTQTPGTSLDSDGSLGEQVIGAERGLQQVFERIDLVARSDAPVLLLGETGSGKEVVARAVHRGSPRASGPFVRVNCGAIPAELIDSQLFGHEKGSFTGATERRSGWFERADGGTLLLDEVAELSPAAQVRLLRVLQDGSLERVGGQASMHVDCRIIAATHRDLPAMVQAGAFREDLWYRLSVFPIVIPPLRERTEDIPALAAHFARRAAQRFGLAECRPSAADLAALTAYPWPGNVRELAAVIDRAALLGEGKHLAVDVALGLGSQALSRAQDPNDSPRSGARNVPIKSLAEAIRTHIERALASTAGRIEGPGGAADLLDINPHTLRSKMRKLGLDWQRFRVARPDNSENRKP